VKVAH
jgi:hypothetical protein